MVKGLDIFRERFRQFEGSFTLIGGAACVEWFTAQGLSFRATKDLDIVLMIEVIDQAFVAAMRAFVAEGKYEIRERSEGVPILYRFAKPAQEGFPYMVELFSRSPEGFDLSPDQEIIPVAVDPGQHSLSAILLDDAYYGLIQTHHDLRDGVRVANATALIPLKAYAWLNLTQRKSDGETVDAKNIDKQRADVFRLAATLPGEPGPELPSSIAEDLTTFLQAFPADSAEWTAILASLKSTLGGGLRPETLRQAIQTFFRLPVE
ncbi:MAG: hypothetical protein NTX35_23015 [Verrucomicrobia bacterium]|nr:hypothetical protein [Verrucomicrobiota bacterium]